MRSTLLFLFVFALFVTTPTVSAADLEPSTQMVYGRYTPTQITQARLRKLFKALSEYRKTFDAMPKSVTELLDLGYITNQSDLVDARHPILIQSINDEGPVDRVDRFRIVQTWREGAVATTDLPHQGNWIILNHDGSIDIRPVASQWLGRYTPKKVSDTELENFLSHPASRLGVVASSASTDTGRKGLGVDRIIPGFSRNRIDYRYDSDLIPGDLILSVNGKHFDTLEEYASEAKANPPATFSAWERPILEIIRQGKIQTVCALNTNEHFPYLQTSKAVYQLARICMSQVGPGAININTEKNDTAGRRIKKATTDHTSQYLHPGDILLRIDDQPVPQYLPSFYPKPAGSQIQLTIERNGNILQIPFPLDQTNAYTRSKILDSIQMGLLDLDAVRKRRTQNPEHVGINLWLMGLHQTHGPEIATQEAKRLYESDNMFKFRRFKAWVGQLQRSQKYQQTIELIDQELKKFTHHDHLAECMLLKAKTLTLWGRIDDAVRYAKTIPIADERYKQTAFGISGFLMKAGYPIAVLDIGQVYLHAKPDDENLKAGVEILKEHIQRLDNAMQN